MEDNRNALFNLSRVCRFCLSQAGVMSSIFNQGDTPSTPSVANKIMVFSRIQLIANDGLPSILCHRCLYLAEKSFEFKTQCEASDSMLRKYLSMVQATIPTQVPPEIELSGKGADHMMQSGSIPIGIDIPIKRKRGRPRKAENLIFYSSPPPTITHVVPPKAEHMKMVDEIPTAVPIVDARSDIPSNSDDDLKREPVEVTEKEPLDSETVRSLAIARAKAKKYMGVVFGVDENCQTTRRHLCKGCGKTFGHCSDLRKHVLVHTGERPFHCQLCDKTFSRSTNLNKHLKVHTGQKPYSCTDSHCPKSFASKGDLQRHLVIHSGIKPFRCHLCEQCFSRKDKLTRHVKLHDDPLSVRVNNSKTGWTGHNIGVTEYENDFDLWKIDGEINGDDGEKIGDDDDNSSDEMADNDAGNEIESMVINLDPFAVDGQVKDSTFERDDAGQKTEKVCEEGEEGASTEFLHCPQCLQIFTDSVALSAHLTTHAADKPHKCSKCPNKSFARRRELIRHETVHTGLKPFECNTCHRAFARKDKLARHKKIHEPKKLFCELCSMEFSNDDLLKNHMDYHMSGNYNSEDELNDNNGGQESENGFSEDEGD